MAIKAVIDVVIHNGCVLLARKQRKVNNGFLTPFGGKLEPGEDFEDAVIRELWQESGMACERADVEKVGRLIAIDRYPSTGRSEMWEIDIYLIHGVLGDPLDTTEMCDAHYFPFTQLPLESMPPADIQWMPPVLRGENVIMYADYDAENHILMHSSIATYKRLSRK